MIFFAGLEIKFMFDSTIKLIIKLTTLKFCNILHMIFVGPNIIIIIILSKLTFNKM